MEVAQAHEKRGSVFTIIAPTQAGRRALHAEGVEALSLGEFFAGPVQRATADAPQHVVIPDDAHRLGLDPVAGMGSADALLARVEMMGAKLVALVKPECRPARSSVQRHRKPNVDFKHSGGCRAYRPARDRRPGAAGPGTRVAQPRSGRLPASPATGVHGAGGSGDRG